MAASDVVCWPRVCGNQTVYDTFWNADFTINTYNPDLTDCFQKTALTWISCGVLWLVFPIYAYYLSSWRSVHPWGSISRWNLIQVIVISLLAMTNLVDLVYLLMLDTDGSADTHITPADYSSIVIRLLTYVLACFLTHWCFKKGEHSPGVLFIFWALQLLAGIVTFRSKLLRLQKEGSFNDLFTFVTFYVKFGLIAAQFILSLFADVEATLPPQQAETMQEECSPLLGGSSKEEEQNKNPTIERKPCPAHTASFPSLMYFGWFFPKVIQGYKRSLTYDDIWDLQTENTSAGILPHFERAWKQEESKACKQRHNKYQPSSHQTKPKTNYGGVGDSSFQSKQTPPTESQPESSAKCPKKPSLLGALARMLGAYYIPQGLLLLGMDICTILNPLLLQQLIGFVQTKGQYEWQGYALAVVMFVLSSFNMLFFVHYFNGGYVSGLRCRTALTSAIYRKSLKLSNAARKFTTVGEIVNLMSVDVEKIVQLFLGFHFLWSAPLVLIVSVILQYRILGPSCLTGLLVLFVIIPINSAILAKQIRKLQKEQMLLKDQRIKLMNQVLNGIKVLKLYAWEPQFRDQILNIRSQELEKLRRVSLLSAATYSLWFLSPFLVALLDFITYVFVSPDGRLDPQVAFTTLSLIQAQNFQFNMLPQVIMWIVQGMVSIKRIEKFFVQEEVNEANVQEDFMEDAAVKIEDGTFSWGEEDRVTLNHVSLSVPTGSLVGIVGQVGAGKSSLISAILGEMEKHRGRVIVNGSVAYVPQQAWIQNLTLRDNVLFSRPYIPKQYSTILEACALRPDLDTLPGGDMTEIGERGINLSGGQKQRVSLARAVYQDTQTYLLDDPLSAVDAHVGKHIFKHVVGPDGLLKHKTRLLVTHSITHLSKMDLIIVMKDGTISEIGGYEELLDHQGAFSEFIHTYLAENPEVMSDDPEDQEEIEKLKRLVSTSDTGAEASSIKSESSLRRRGKARSSISGASGESRVTKATRERDLREKSKLVEIEQSAEGTISMAVVKAYASAATPKFCILAITCLAFYTAAMVGTNIWLSEWTNDSLLNATTQDIPTPGMRLGVYGAFGVLQMIGVFILSITVVLGSVSASSHLHSALTHKIVHCPMSFFDTTPIGRILNRFSKDVDIMDTNIQQFILNLFLIGGPLLTIIIVIAYTTPVFIAAVIPIAIMFIMLQRFYVHCSRQIKRIDSVKKSPIYAFFSETLTGTSVIRAYQQQSRFISHSDHLLDSSQRVWFEVFSSNRWVNVWAELVGDLVILFAGIVVVLQRDSINPSLAGLSLTFALQISFNLVFVVRNTCDLETYIVSVERIKEYADLAPEAPWVIAGKRPPRDWPVKGSIDFKSYRTRYRAGMDLVLKDVSFHVAPEEKVGVVGRTGAGKSSMTLGLFRILEAAGGRIEIDGINISDMGLHDLRSKLTIIPQDPVLFSGPLRFNLDPAEKHTDSEVWQALEQAHLKSFVDTLPDTLMYECGENGENMSVGQRQLVCLARALLRKTKILILDEATAAVDMETDDLIQSTIRSEFEHCTVLTIAHRLNTILDYDRVIVMADGLIKEVDSPNKLRDDKSSLFYSMAKDAGIV